MSNTFGHEDAASASGDELTASLDRIVRNYAVREFLENDNKCYVIGMKGSGKTLLLLKKAIEKREENQSVLIIPKDSNNPVDRLMADENVGKKLWHKTKGSNNRHLIWAVVWKNAIMKAIIYNHCDVSGEIVNKYDIDVYDENYENYINVLRIKLKNRLRNLFGDPPYFDKKSVFNFYFDVVTFLEDSSISEHDKIVRENEMMRTMLRDLTLPVYIYIDNLDNYYEQQPELWLESMFGLFRVIREIRLDFRHIHVYTSFRKDVYNRFQTEQLLQYNDFISFLDYSREELFQMFAQGIQSLNRSHLIEPFLKDSNPWRAFFGEDIVNNFHNAIVSEKEDIRQYIFRHSLWRPRDMIVIGNKILEEKGDKQMSADIVRGGVENAAKEIQKQYLDEISPMLPPSVDLASLISEFMPNNILTSNDLKSVCMKYNNSRGDQCNDDCRRCNFFHPGCMLYSMGLIGYVDKSTKTGKYIQKFLRPGEMDGKDQIEKIPKVDYYVLHPILNNLLRNNHIDDRQIVGYRQEFDINI